MKVEDSVREISCRERAVLVKVDIKGVYRRSPAAGYDVQWKMFVERAHPFGL